MASRFTDTDLWNEDWFCEMPGEYQLFIKYVFDKCDNAGIWKPNKFDFEMKTKFKVSPDLLFKKMNVGGGGERERVLLLSNGRWFITGYILFQWFNKKKTFDLVLSNRLHKSLYDILVENKVDLKTVRGLREVLKTSMVMVMDEKVVRGPGEEGKPDPPKDAAVFPIEDCLVFALKDPRWVKANKTNEGEVREFISKLERRGIYEKNPLDFKTHFANWKMKGKTDESLTNGSIREFGNNEKLNSLYGPK